MNKTACIALSLVTIGVVGCAKVSIRKIDKDSTAEGVRFYRPKPYLLVTAEPQSPPPTTAPGAAPAPEPTPAEPKVTTSIIWLPNMKDEYVVELKEGWGVAESNVTLADGWKLVSVGAKQDSKGPETITAVSGLLTSVAGLKALFLRQNKNWLEPGLYEIQFDEKTGTVSGFHLIQ